ncbi:MAG: alpha/beta hydrolase [Parvibaculaceae bacterium]|nr:alpha/beta hydrolase [Parvibaculaceae bacterium]HBM90068.1 alpha/beta hydrolase [Rhodobiaceae bacterium]|tara:strand:- start:7781 stop:8680 length:900 start_codon:yes stop_codon:yes gene_type:complete
MNSSDNKTVTLPQGRVTYRDVGASPPIIFVHGLFLNGTIWDKTIERLTSHRRCIVPELPLGAHKTPLNKEADLSLTGVAQLIADFLEELDLNDVTLVGLDFGGVIAQIVAARHTERVSRLVLTNCDALEVCPAKGFEYLTWLPRVPLATWTLAKLMHHVGPLRRHETSFAAFAKAPLPDAQLKDWVRPMAVSSGVRRDVKKLLRSIDARLTLALPGELKSAGTFVLLAWGAEDELFSMDLARRLTAAIGDNAFLAEIPDAKTFVPHDAPKALASTILAFTATPPWKLTGASQARLSESA